MAAIQTLELWSSTLVVVTVSNISLSEEGGTALLLHVDVVSNTSAHTRKGKNELGYI